MTRNLKRSIREKYQRREKWLYETLQDYLIHANERLDVNIAGTARDKDNIEEIVKKCKELLNLLPKPKDDFPDIDLEAILQSAPDVDAILTEGKDWREKFSEDDLKGLKASDETKK
ncbi:hypothetical protein [Acinetobacter brisouii]